MCASGDFFKKQHKREREKAKAEANTAVKVETTGETLKLDNINESPIPKIIHKVWMVFNPNKPGIREKYKESDRILKKIIQITNSYIVMMKKYLVLFMITIQIFMISLLLTMSQ